MKPAAAVLPQNLKLETSDAEDNDFEVISTYELFPEQRILQQKDQTDCEHPVEYDTDSEDKRLPKKVLIKKKQLSFSKKVKNGSENGNKI